MCSPVPQICLLLQQCLDGTDPGTPLAPASDHSPTFFPVPTFGVSHSAILGHQDQLTPFFELNSLLPITPELPDSSELFHQGGGRHQLPGQHASAGLLHLPPLGASISTATSWLWRAWATFSANWWGRSARVPASLENAKPVWQPCPLRGHAEAISR